MRRSALPTASAVRPVQEGEEHNMLDRFPSKEAVEKLVGAGRTRGPRAEADRALEALAGEGALNSVGPDLWGAVAQGLRTDDLAALIRGLVIAERKHDWKGGSVAAAIWVFRLLKARDPAVANEVAEFALAHTNNPYVPFGTQNHGARSLAEYGAAVAEHEAAVRAGLVEQKRDAARAAEERAVRARARAQSAVDRRSAIRSELIEQLSRLPLAERLSRIALDAKYSVNFFPTSWAEAAKVDILQALAPETRVALLTKLKGGQRGPWGEFKRRLSSVHRTPWRSQPWT